MLINMGQYLEVTFEKDKWLWGIDQGSRRLVSAVIKKRAGYHGAVPTTANNIPYEAWGLDINSACGELAVAEWLGVPWDGTLDKMREHDVGGLLEVRTTRGHNYPLCLHDTDKRGSPYILVTGTGPSYRIQGYILCERGLRDEWYHDQPEPAYVHTDRFAYWVPQPFLNRDFDTLEERFHAAYAKANPEPVT